MARKTNRKQDREKPRLGSLSPQYNFFLNPYLNFKPARWDFVEPRDNTPKPR